MRKGRGKQAQTAVELAVFGSILIFVMGTIIRTVLGQSNQLHSILRGTRMALTMSHRTTETDKAAGRNSASVLIVEDRLTGASSKYGAIDRIPLINQGSGTHSRHLFMPVDFGDAEDLPLFDMFINGKHFVFSTAGFKYISVSKSCQTSCSADCRGDCTATSPYYMRGSDGDDIVGPNPIANIPVEGIPDGPDYWEPNCVESTEVTTLTNPCADTDGVDPPDECPPLSTCSDCRSDSWETYQSITTEVTTIGCPKFYTVVQNHPLITDWCDDISKLCTTNLSVNERFNLDRANATDPDGLDGLAGTVTVPNAERPGFSWQWFLVSPVDSTASPPLETDEAKLLLSPMLNNNVSYSNNLTAGAGEEMILPGGEAEPKNVSLDVDYDLKLEIVMPNVEANGKTQNVVDEKSGIIRQIGVMDMQEGDIDFTYDDSDELKGIEPFGLTKDLVVYTYVRDDGLEGGTYFEVNEGQLFAADTRQFIRTASKKDQVDLIERVFRLSRNTGGYCDASGARTLDTDFQEHYGLISNEPNPVEVCVNTAGACFNGGNINLTCMDTTSNIIYIRSRIQDFHGRKWVTETTSDPYVDFQIR